MTFVVGIRQLRDCIIGLNSVVNTQPALNIIILAQTPSVKGIIPEDRATMLYLVEAKDGL